MILPAKGYQKARERVEALELNAAEAQEQESYSRARVNATRDNECLPM